MYASFNIALSVINIEHYNTQQKLLGGDA